jgi:hypothetical protein
MKRADYGASITALRKMKRARRRRRAPDILIWRGSIVSLGALHSARFIRRASFVALHWSFCL